MELLDVIKSTGGITAIAEQLGLSESQAHTGAAALLPAIVAGFQKQAQGGGGLEGLVSMLTQSGGAGLLENVLGSQPTNTSLGGDLLGQIFGSKEVSREVAGQAAQSTGLNVDTLKKMLPILVMLAGGLLAKRGNAASGGGLLDQLGGLLGGIGGGNAGGLAGGLGKLLDQDGNGNPLDDVLRSAGKFFGK